MDSVPDRPVAVYKVDLVVVGVLARRNVRFHEYDRVPAAVRVEDLLAEVDQDPTAIFWS